MLHYGGCVTLALSEGAFLYSKGFTDSSAYIERFPSDLEFSMAVFRVLPSCTYSIQREVLAARTKSTTVERLALLEESLEGEMKTNIQTYAASKGGPVKFGALIQFEHVSSHKYLTVQSHETAETERDHLRVSLEDFGGELSLFRVEAAFQFQATGDQCVRYGDQVKVCTYIPQFSKTAFLHTSASPRSQKGMGTIITFAEGRRESKLEERFEVNASLEHPSLWTVNLFSAFIPENSLNILIGDSVWFSNSELDFALVGEGDIATAGANGDTNGLWTLEDKNEMAGGKVLLGNSYRLRHLSTGLYLSVQSHREDFADATAFAAVIAHMGVKVQQPMLQLTSKKNEYSMWTFESIASRKNTESLLKDEFFKVKNTATELYLHFTTKDDAPEAFMDTLESDTNVFKVVKCDEALLLETKFLINSLPLLRRFPKFIERHNDLEPELHEYREFRKFTDLIRKTIKDLQLFCENRLTSLVAFTKQYGRVEGPRQKLLREQKCLEALTNLLKHAFTGRYDLANSVVIEVRKQEHHRQMSTDYDQAERKELRELAEMAYELIDMICKENVDSQRYAHQFFPLFQLQAPHLEHCIPCMITIVSGSEELLLRVNRSEGSNTVIPYFSSMLQESSRRRPQLLRFLQSLCSFNSAGLSANQEKVHEHLFAPGSAVIQTAV